MYALTPNSQYHIAHSVRTPRDRTHYKKCLQPRTGSRIASHFHDRCNADCTLYQRWNRAEHYIDDAYYTQWNINIEVEVASIIEIPHDDLQRSLPTVGITDTGTARGIDNEGILILIRFPVIIHNIEGTVVLMRLCSVGRWIELRQVVHGSSCSHQDAMSTANHALSVSPKSQRFLQHFCLKLHLKEL